MEINEKRKNVYLKNNPGIKNLILIFGGLFVGVANGFFGGGGGMIVVPLLTSIACLDIKTAHATAVCTILPLSIISSVIYIINKNFSTYIALKVGIGTILGGFIGVFLLKKLSPENISFVFYILMLVTGIKMIVG